MIRLILRGRTGNILFQYAMGRMLADKHGVPLILGAHWYHQEGWKEVAHFLKLPILAKLSRGGIPVSLASRTLRKLTQKHYWEYLRLPVLKEAPHNQSFDPRFLDAPADCVLCGYFQTPRYFETVDGVLRRELSDLVCRGAHAPRMPSSMARGRDWKTILSQPNTVAVHVRRGDFMRLPVFQVCDESYYLHSMDEMRFRVPDARFFIFSDDPQWCRSTFSGADTEVINGFDTVNPLYILYLMSLASHHVIANSSFSWWAAWLGEKPDQNVIMPDRWYAKDIISPIEEKRGGDHWIIIK